MTPPRPRVSILLPARNAAATIPDCLASIRRQTEPRWECIIVDDGSTDGTRDIAARAAEDDGRFRVVSIAHAGLVSALNEGLRHCHGDLVARMDADDLMHRHRLEAQAACLDRNRDLAAVGCHVRMFPRAALSPRMREYEAWLNSLGSADEVARDALVECPVAHPSLMMRRSMAGLGYVDRGWPEDYDLVLRALGRGLRIGLVPRRLLAWRRSRRSLSRLDPRYARMQFTRCKAHFLAGGFLAARSDYVLWGFGETGKALHKALAALGKHPSHIVEVHPRRLGRRIHGAPVLPPEGMAGLRGRPAVVSVAREGPRSECRGMLAGMGFTEGLDYVCTA
ncbi:MAG TPA: glycosyltransferase family A protein [Vicinamibacterales bacterium]|nr:glycosyltransferase family A protein [Vicinamibacterales bacterium]HPW20465.1 glycosyltransferase family A protein [Vicinamibacterales bacterium]